MKLIHMKLTIPLLNESLHKTHKKPMNFAPFSLKYNTTILMILIRLKTFQPTLPIPLLMLPTILTVMI